MPRSFWGWMPCWGSGKLPDNAKQGIAFKDHDYDDDDDYDDGEDDDDDDDGYAKEDDDGNEQGVWYQGGGKVCWSGGGEMQRGDRHIISSNHWKWSS